MSMTDADVRAEIVALRGEVAALKCQVAALRAERQDDPDADARLFAALWDVGGGMGAVFRVRDMIRAVLADPALMARAVAAVGDGGSLPIRLGRWLERVAGRDFGGCTVIRLDADDGGVALWQFVEV